MSEEGCYCGWGNSEIALCPFCRIVEREREQELWDLRAWKEKARPFLEADYNSRFSFQAPIRKVGTKEEREQLAELLKEATK